MEKSSARIDPGEIGDVELLSLAQEWRQKAVRGDRQAHIQALKLESELQRRLGAATTIGAPLENSAKARLFRSWRAWLK